MQLVVFGVNTCASLSSRLHRFCLERNLFNTVHDSSYIDPSPPMNRNLRIIN